MSRRSPTLEASKQSAPTNFSLDPCSLVVQGVPPRQRRRQTPCSAQTGTTNYDLFSTSSFDCNFSRNDNQTFNEYMESTLSIYRKGLCAFFWFSNSPRKIFYVNQSVATISDQREYIMYNFDNYSHEYKTRWILDLDKILLLPSCRNVNCFINNHLISCYSHIILMR